MRRVLTVSRHTCRVKSGKYLPWHSVISVNQYLAKARWDCNLKTHTALFFFPLRETQDEGRRAISSATCHSARHLSHALVVSGAGVNPLFSHSKKTRATPFHLIPFSLPSFSSESASVAHLRALLGTGSRSFSPPSSVESRLCSVAM